MLPISSRTLKLKLANRRKKWGKKPSEFLAAACVTVLNCCVRFLETEQANNKEKEVQMSHAERQIQKIRLQHNQEEQDLATFQVR